MIFKASLFKSLLIFIVLISLVSSIKLEERAEKENLLEEIQGIHTEPEQGQGSISEQQWESPILQPGDSVAEETLIDSSKSARSSKKEPFKKEPFKKKPPYKPGARPKPPVLLNRTRFKVGKSALKPVVYPSENGTEAEYSDLDVDAHNNPPESLSGEIRPHEPLEGKPTYDGTVFKGDSELVPPGKATKIDHSAEFPAEPELNKDIKEQPFALFTIANTDINTPYEQLPYREKYQWMDRRAPCHTFDLKIPDELAEKSMITLCIFRPNLEFPDEPSKRLILSNDDLDKDTVHNVLGHVVDVPESSVYGRIKNGFFYGEVSVIDKDRNVPTVFVIEEISLLSKLMRHNPKTLDHMLVVMHNVPDNEDKFHNKSTVYNAVVTKGASLINFMLYTSTINVNRNPFLMFSTSHNSYITSGEPIMQVDDRGQIRIETGNHIISVDTEGYIRISIPGKQYIFRPNGRTIVKEGMAMRTLQEHEGSLAITAYTASSIYDCLLPTPAFNRSGNGGYVCRICLAMDDSFREHYIEKHVPKSDPDLARNYLGHIIDRVSWIFRSMDLNGDNHPDNIGLDYESQALHWTYLDSGKEDVNEKDLDVLLQSLETYSFEDCCLGMGFTMKNFPRDILGKRTQVATGPSGACSGRSGRISSNLIIMTANNKKGNFGTITEQQLIYATANQIASAFGANPDGTGNDECDQFFDENRVTRHHLMWPDVMRNTTLPEQALSSCSKADIFKTLTTCISSCFEIDRHPFCGNGIVEEGEECDCGSEENCTLQKCCYSRIEKHPCRKTGIGCSSGAPYILATPTITLVTFTLLTLNYLGFQ